MFTRKTLIALALSLVMVVLPVASAYAAPVAQTATAVDCTVQSLSISTDSSGVTTVQVTCADGTTASLTTDQALALGLVTQNPDGTFTTNDAMIGQVVSITPTAEQDPCAAPTTTGDTTGSTTTTTATSTGDTTTGGGAALDPVAQALCTFFGLDYQTIQDFHAETGYGVIAQACFMAQLLSTDCSAVLDAKLNGDYSGLTLPDGTQVTNWGQLRKAVFGKLLGKGGQSSYNLGAIMSGRAQPEDGTLAPASSSTNEHGKGGHGNNGHHGKP